MVSNRPTQPNERQNRSGLGRYFLVWKWLEIMVLITVVVAAMLIAELIAPQVLPYLQLTLSGDKPRVFWYLGRSSAFVAYGLLWLAMVFGLLLTNKLARLWPGGPTAMDIHQYSSLLSLGFSTFHAFILMGSRFLHYDMLDVLIPFHSNAYRTIWVGLGQLSLYGMAILVGSFYVRRKITQRMWRLIHYLSFAVFVMVTAHGLRAGTDSGSRTILGIYAFSAISVAFLIMCRVAYQLALKVANPMPQAATLPQHATLTQTPLSAVPAIATAIVYGSQSGNAEGLAKRTAKMLSRDGARDGVIVPVLDGARFDVAKLSELQRLILITSTYGDGEPPDNIAAFYQQLHAAAAPQISHLAYCVLALGDHSYPTFCKAGRDFDARLAALGAQRLCKVATCDTDYEADFQTWLGQVVAACAAGKPSAAPTPKLSLAPAALPIKPNAPAHPNSNSNDRYTKSKFFVAPIVLNNNLHQDGFSKYVRQVAFSLKGSGLRYEPGDALGVMPTNRPELVSEMIKLLGLSGEEAVPLPDGGEASLHEALLHEYDITKLTPAHMQYFAERTDDASLRVLLKPGNAQALKDSLYGRQIIDLLAAYPGTVRGAKEFVAMLGKLKPRLYSIASSQAFCAEEVHLTMGVVRYPSYGRMRHGVCSGDVARTQLNATRPIFVHSSKTFRLPADSNTPIIMVGPGTGIAPFRSFLQERAATGAPGKNWLFFGCCNARYDFLYRAELEQFQAKGLLSRFDVAFSRDQEEKIYVQHLMRQQAAELWRWLEGGAHFYVCGDAARMAKDVDAALHDVAIAGGGLSKDGAAEWVQTLKQQKRYLRDVY